MKSSTKWGLISGLSAGLWMVLIMFLEIKGLSAGSLGNIPAWIFYIVGIYLAILQTRLNDFGGFIDFRNCFRTGLQAASIASVIWNLLMVIFYIIISQEDMQKLFPLDSPEQIASRKNILTEVQVFVISTVITILIGTFISIILSFILKKEPDQEQPQP
jgi:hypothetical protein